MRIGQIANLAGVSTSLLRYYESIDLIQSPRRDTSGYRNYDDCDLESIRTIVNTRKLGFSFPDIQELLAMRDKGETPCPYLVELLEQKNLEVQKWFERLGFIGVEVNQLHALALTFPTDQVRGKVCTFHSSNGKMAPPANERNLKRVAS